MTTIKMQKQTTKPTLISQMRKNPFIPATIILSIVCLCLIGANLLPNLEESILPAKNPNPADYFCNKTTSTPSWGDINGNIIDVGYKNFSILFGNQSVDIVNEFLIPNKVFFIYNPGCGWCQKQIEYFGLTWQDYVNSGFTVVCGGVE